MTTEILKNIRIFILLVLIQVLIIQNINLSGYIILLPYVMVILVLPFEMNRILVLFISFFLGITIDLFYDTSGIHAFASTLLGFTRFFLLKYISPREGYEAGVKPLIKDFGFSWFLKYSFILIFIHHLFIFYIEIFRFSEFFKTLLRVILSSTGTFCTVYLFQLFFFDKKSKT